MKRRILSICLMLMVALMIWTLWGNAALQITEYTISSDRIPESFAGFRIAQISDLHNTEFGEGNEMLLSMLEETRPDMIVLTGDLIDSRHTDVEIALNFARQALEIAPVYYVTGNHEARVVAYQGLKAGLEESGVTVLENRRLELTRAGELITLIGLNDPSFRADGLFYEEVGVSASLLAGLQKETDGFTILLAHRPELFDVYVDAGVDLVFSGHAHGGQFRLPFVGGLVAPNQGLFPEYDGGMFTKNNTTMIVSRGVGNSIIPVRFNNRPEIVVAELRSADE